MLQFENKIKAHSNIQLSELKQLVKETSENQLQQSDLAKEFTQLLHALQNQKPVPLNKVNFGDPIDQLGAAQPGCITELPPGDQNQDLPVVGCEQRTDRLEVEALSALHQGPEPDQILPGLLNRLQHADVGNRNLCELPAIN